MKPLEDNQAMRNLESVFSSEECREPDAVFLSHGNMTGGPMSLNNEEDPHQRPGPAGTTTANFKPL